MDSYSDCCCMSGLAGLQAGFYADNARICEIIDAPYYLNTNILTDDYDSAS